MVLQHYATKKYFFTGVFTLVTIIACLGFFPQSLFALTTNDPVVNLRFTVPVYINSIRLSNFPNFQDEIILPYMGEPVSWNICHGRSVCERGMYYVYADFLRNGTSIRVSSNVVEYQKEIVQAPKSLPEKEVEVEPEPEITLPPVEIEQPTLVPEPEIIPVVVPEIIVEPVATLSFSFDDALQSAGRGLAVAGVTGSFLATTIPFLSSASNFSEIIMVFLRLWNSILVLVGLRRKVKPWGVVYDSSSKQPLDPAYVTLLDENENEIATSITDINGRYGFLVPTGTYHIQAGKTHYSFPSKRMAGRRNDALYNDLYFGEPVTVVDGGVIAKNIPMDSDSADWNQEEKKRMGVGNISAISVPIAWFVNSLFYVGLSFTLIMAIYSPSILNSVLLAVYIVILILRIFGFRPRSYGTLKIQETGESVGQAIVKVFSKSLNRQVAHAVSDTHGHYYSLVPKGEYYVKIEKKLGEEEYKEVFTSKPIPTPRGIINKSFEI